MSIVKNKSEDHLTLDILFSVPYHLFWKSFGRVEKIMYSNDIQFLIVYFVYFPISDTTEQFMNRSKFEIFFKTNNWSEIIDHRFSPISWSRMGIISRRSGSNWSRYENISTFICTKRIDQIPYDKSEGTTKKSSIRILSCVTIFNQTTLSFILAKMLFHITPDSLRSSIPCYTFLRFAIAKMSVDRFWWKSVLLWWINFSLYRKSSICCRLDVFIQSLISITCIRDRLVTWFVIVTLSKNSFTFRPPAFPTSRDTVILIAFAGLLRFLS